MERKIKKNNYFDDEDANLDYANFENVDDRQYQQILPNKKGKLDSLSYFKTSEKYAGRVKHTQDEYQDEGKNGEMSEQEQSVEEDGIKQSLNEIKKKRKERSKLLQEDLRAIDRQDKDNLVRMKQEQKGQGSPEALQNQLTEFHKLVQIRYYSQKNLQEMKKYPTHNYPTSQPLHELQKESQKIVLESLEQLVQNYEKLVVAYFYKQNEEQFQLTKYQQILDSNSSYMKNNRLNVEALWQKFEEETKDINEKMEREIINWSQRTALLRNSANKSQYNSLLMQTPVGQARKVIGDWQKVSKKCQQKRSPFRILFETEQNLRQNTDISIYDDLDLLQQVQKVYEQEVQKDDNDFLVNDTLKYLQNRQKSKVVKDVDRKASKNRKIRYNVHAKLLNFMPCQNDNLLEARDQIVKNLFNKGSTQQQEEVDYID